MNWKNCAMLMSERASCEDLAKSFEKEAELETLFFSLSEEEALAGEHAEEYRELRERHLSFLR